MQAFVYPFLTILEQIHTSGIMGGSLWRSIVSSVILPAAPWPHPYWISSVLIFKLSSAGYPMDGGFESCFQGNEWFQHIFMHLLNLCPFLGFCVFCECGFCTLVVSV